MRILHIAAANSTAGGGEKHVLDCVTKMAEAGHDVILAAPSGGNLGASALAAHARFYPLEISRGVKPQQFSELKRIISAETPDIIHAHGHRAAFFARRADGKASSRVVYTFHGIHVDKGPLSFLKIENERSLVNKTAHFVAVSHADKKLAERLKICKPETTSVVHNGVPQATELRRGAFREEIFGGKFEIDTPLILLVGRISEPKNLIKGALPIFNKVCSFADEQKKPLPFLAMICPGTGEQFLQLAEAARATKWGSRIKVLPRRSSLDQAYTDADVFFLPSFWEGSPYVVLEALSYGLPVAAFQLEGIAEAVDNGLSGVLAPCFDNDALAQKLFAMLQDRNALTLMGECGRQHVAREFSLTDMVEHLLAIYENVLNSGDAD